METGNDNTNLKELMSAGIDMLTIVISRDEILRKDITASNKILKQLIEDRNVASYFRERVEIAFDGFNHTRQELWEIPEVRDFIDELDSAFPYWLFFLTKHGNGLIAIIKCFLLPFLKPEVEKAINGEKLKSYLDVRGFPAMNKICDILGISKDENIEMTNRFVKYVQEKY